MPRGALFDKANDRLVSISSIIAFTTFFLAWPFVLPCEKAPGISGIVAIQNPSSPGSSRMVSSTLTPPIIDLLLLESIIWDAIQRPVIK
jgi:hypothetical protein